VTLAGERPPALAGAAWGDWARVYVAIGILDTWAPTGEQWGAGTWGSSTWGMGFLTPSRWVDVTADVLSLDVDTGRNGIDDPGEVGAATVTLSDPAGAYGVGGSTPVIGELLRVSAVHVASGTSRAIYSGRVVEAKGAGDLAAPTTTLRAVDLLGAVLSTDDDRALPAQTVSERLDELLDLADWPADLRDLAPDATPLLAIDKAGNRLDAARGAAKSSLCGALWATGAGVISYRWGAPRVPEGSSPDYSIGTVEGYVCPSTLDLGEAFANIANVYDWATTGADPLHSSASSPSSVAQFGRCSSVRSDLLVSDQATLDSLVAAWLGRTAWARDRVDRAEVEVYDDASAALVLVRLFDLIAYDYSGPAPWSRLEVVASVSHSITPDAWSVKLSSAQAEVVATWGTGTWGSSTWAAG
jgi:hypothetical protein